VRRFGRAPDWAAIVLLYEALQAITGSPVAALNHAVALAHADGSAAGLAALSTLESDVRLRDYQPYWAARADLLVRNGDKAGAAHAYQRAIGLERDPSVRAFLQRKAQGDTG
jgi:RNA polymerase sigma-70 factor (ECF subfamily)